jgi:hypothetical protein
MNFIMKTAIFVNQSFHDSVKALGASRSTKECTARAETGQPGARPDSNPSHSPLCDVEAVAAPA